MSRMMASGRSTSSSYLFRSHIVVESNHAKKSRVLNDFVRVEWELLWGNLSKTHHVTYTSKAQNARDVPDVNHAAGKHSAEVLHDLEVQRVLQHQVAHVERPLQPAVVELAPVAAVVAHEIIHS
jgi:hypothetical protein